MNSQHSQESSEDSMDSQHSNEYHTDTPVYSRARSGGPSRIPDFVIYKAGVDDNRSDILIAVVEVKKDNDLSAEAEVQLIGYMKGMAGYNKGTLHPRLNGRPTPVGVLIDSESVKIFRLQSHERDATIADNAVLIASTLMAEETNALWDRLDEHARGWFTPKLLPRQQGN
ncbi:hypothetical protein E1B28_003316 [Marasmius oreades]|uniref:Uncharacterized protein n=1 Tax=Marasmius oreades TaxID=181124 RepID=A0A9P7UKL9_9AGAR|nr:uncharacterized protein E1B28_003316 [Marasmius oreades]KAG7085775.1 hypothetical protein E1B28_003316 [Marasmius oreades]